VSRWGGKTQGQWAAQRRRGQILPFSPEQIIAKFEARWGDQALVRIVEDCASPATFTADRVRYRKCIRILIRRAIRSAEVFREAARVAPDRQSVWAPSSDRYTPGYWTGD
jgi:hypothetical protein